MIDVHDSYIQVAADAGGKKLQTSANTIGGNEVHTEAVYLVTSAGVAITTLPVSIAAAITANPSKSGTATCTNVSNSASSVQLLAANSARLGATFYNDDTAAIVKLKLGTTASSTSFTIAIAPGGYYELPQPCYTGRIDAIASVATGAMRITELS